MATWVTTDGQLAKALDVSRQTISKYKKRNGFPKKTKRGWHVPKCQKCVEQWRVKEAQPKESAKSRAETWRAELQCRKLELSIAETEGKVMLLIEARDMMTEYAGVVNQVYDVFLEEVKSTIRNPKLTKKAMVMVKAAKRRLAKKIAGLDKAAKK